MTSTPSTDRPLKVAFADDSLTIRKLVRQLITDEPQLVLQLEARNGLEVVDRFQECHPDVVLLDTEMPKMNGLDTLIELRSRNKRVPILMFSMADAVSNELVLDAMACGANDLCKKPELVGSVDGVLRNMRQEITPRITMWGKAYHQQAAPASASHDLSNRLANKFAQTPNIEPPTLNGSLEMPATDDACMPAWRANRQSSTSNVLEQKAGLVIIAASIERIESLLQVLNDLTSRFNSPIVVMIEGLASRFSGPVIERLSNVSGIPVCHLQAGPIVPNRVSVVPGDALAAIQFVDNRPELFLTPALTNSSVPAVLFSSAAIAFGSELLVVMLAGTESHSIASCSMVRQKGGRIILESQQESVRDVALVSNPLLTTRCLPVEAIADAIAGTPVPQNI